MTKRLVSRWLRTWCSAFLLGGQRSRSLSFVERLRRGLAVEELEPRWLPSVSQVAFITAPQTLTAGDQSGLITIQLEDSSGNPATSGSNITFQLSTNSTAGSFLDSNGNTLTGSSLTIPAGNSSAGFEYLDSNSGVPTLTAAGGGLSATQQETVNPASTQLNSLASFNPGSADPQGNLVEDSNGDLFGTANAGGTDGQGAVFELVKGSSTITTLASFNGTNGFDPMALVIQNSSGDLFGTTALGGANNDGTVFELAKDSGTITTLASFDFNNGASPQGNLILDSNGNLFGTTTAGGTNNDGTVFELAQGSSTITTLASFNGTNGNSPNGLVEDSSGNFFGTTISGGADGDGTVFELAKGGGTITTLDSFNGTNGQGPVGGLIEDRSGNLFGATGNGGANGNGTIFELAKGSSTITTLASFDNTNGLIPNGDLIEDSSGNLFGTSQIGGTSLDGTVFELAQGFSSITTLYSFDDSAGEEPTMGVIEDSSGNLFGTAGGGTYGAGTIFELDPDSGTLATLANFNNTGGAQPEASLVQDSSGNLFGTTYLGGASGYGTVFELAKGSSSITTLVPFDATNGTYPGANPAAGLIEDTSGNLFGSTSGGGEFGGGTVFELAPGTGTITSSYSFEGGNGLTPDAAVIEDSSGNLFGTTSGGGANDDGNVFELVHGSNTITTLADFNGTNGTSPTGSLIEDSSGNLFGTTSSGGTGSDGTLFELAQGSSTITTLATFNGIHGANPDANLIMDSSGDLFGTASAGGAKGDGTIFELAHGGSALTTLATFNGANGADPVAGLIQDSSGDFFGTTSGGGANGDGTVFELAKGSGTITTLYTFNGTNGADPLAGVIEDSSGNLFGTTSGGGTYGAGTLFELVPDVATQLAFTTAPQTLSAGSAATLTVQLKNQNGVTIAAGASVTVNLSSTSATGVFLSGDTPVTSVTIPAGSGSVSFQYKDTTAGTPTLTASATGFSSAQQQETVNAASTTTAAANVSATYSAASQAVSLTASVTTSAGTVNEGTETFTILSGSSVIGSPVTVNVGSGAASATYALPAGTSGGRYTINAVYNGTANYGGSTDASHSLTVTPSTTDSLSGTQGTNGWFTSVSVTVTLTASDGNSGIAATYYTIDGGSQQTYTGSAFSVSGEGSHHIAFWSVDLAGNTESAESDNFKIDSIPPAISIGSPSQPITNTAGGPITYTVAYTDSNFASSNLSSTNVHLITTGTAAGTLSFDNGTGATRTVTISNLTGNGTLAIAIDAGSAVDQAGNHAPASGTSTSFTLDNTLPTSTATIQTVGGYSPGTFTVNYTASDPGSSASGLAQVDVYVKGPTDSSFSLAKAFTGASLTSGSFSYTANEGEGTYGFYSVAIDQAGNVQPTPGSAQATANVDATAPTSSVTALPASSPGSFTISWSGQDNAGGSGIASFDIYVSDNGGTFVPFLTNTTATSATYNGLNGHTYGFYSVATDNVGNQQATPSSAQASTTVDTGASLSVSAPGTATAGTAFSVTVSGGGSFGSGYNGTVNLSASDGQTVTPAVVNLVNGSVTVNVTLDKADTVTLTATSGSVSGSSDNITVVSAAAASLDVSAPSTATAGSGFSVMVTGTDQYGNGYDGTVSLSASDGQTVTPATVTLVNGVVVATVTLDMADTLTLSAKTGSVSGTSGSISVASGTVASLGVSAPSTATAGTGFSVTVTGSDQLGDGYNGTVNLSASDGQTVIPSTVTLVNGTATFTVTLDKADSVKLTATAGSVSGSSGSITILSAAATSLSVSTPTTVSAGAGFSVTLTGSDQYGNGYDGTVTLSASDGQTVTPATATLVNGAATVTLTLDKADVITLSATAGSGTGTGNITVIPAAADHLSFGVQPGNTTAGAAINPAVTVQVLDQYGNVLTTGYSGQVTLTVASGPGSFAGGTSVTVPVSQGTAGFSNLKLDTAGSYTLSAASSNVPTGATSGSFAVNPAGADHLTFSNNGQPSNAIAGNVISQQVLVDVVDPYDNVLMSDNTDTVTLNLFYTKNTNGKSVQGLFAGGNIEESVPVSGGIASFTNLVVDTANPINEPYFLIAGGLGGLTGAPSNSFTISPAALSSFAVSSSANTENPAIAGVDFNVSIRARDPFGNTITNYPGGNVTLSCSDGSQTVSVAPSTIKLGTGSQTVEVSLSSVETSAVYLKASASYGGTKITGKSNTFTVIGDGSGPSTLPTYEYTGGFEVMGLSGDAIPLLSRSSSSQDGPLDAQQTFTVIAQNDSQAQSYIQNEEIILQQQDGLDGSTISAVNIMKSPVGQDAFVSDNTLTVIQPVNNTGTPGAVASFALSFQGVNTADDLFQVTVAALDANNNVVTDYTGTVTLDSDDPQFAAPITYTYTSADQGIHSFFINLDTAGLQTLTVTPSSLDGQAITSSEFTAQDASSSTPAQMVDITPNDATSLVMSAPAISTAGSPTAVTVTALDAFGNVVNGYNDTVTLESNGGSRIAGLPPSYTFTSGDHGIHTFPVTFTSANSYTLSADDAALGSTGPSVSVQVTSPAPAKLVITSQPPTTVKAGNGFGLSVEAVDSHGHVVSNFNGLVTLTLAGNPGHTGLDGGTMSSSLTFPAVNGVAEFSGLTLNRVGVGYTLRARCGSLTVTTRAISVTPNTASQLVVIAQPPSNVSAGSPFGLKVAATDAFGNVVSSFRGSVTLTLGGGAGNAIPSGKLTVTLVKGVAVFSGLKITQAGTAYSLTASGSLTSATTNLFNVTAGTATHLAITTQPPASVTAGSAFGLVVTARDAYGNVASSFTGKATLTLASNPGLSTLTGQVTMQATAGIITFTDLLLNNAGTGYVLQAKSGTLTAETDEFAAVS